LSLKDNLKSVKDEIGAEEQFLESIIKGERFYKKYKRYIIIGAIALVIFVVGYMTSTYMTNRNLNLSNHAYETLMKAPKDAEALKELKNKNATLYAVFQFQEALKNKDAKALKLLSKNRDNASLADLASYELSQINNSEPKKSRLLNGFVLLEEGFDLLKKGKRAEASLKFAQIDPNSPLAQIVKNLEHYKVNTK